MTKAQRTLTLLFIIGTLPVIASYGLYLWWKPLSQTNHGELLETHPAGLQELWPEGANSGKTLGEVVRKKWVFLTVQSANCDARCQQKLYLMRQIRTAQNENMERVERVWVILGEGQPDPQLLKLHPGLHLTRVTDLTKLSQLPLSTDSGAFIFLIDPLGNLVLRYDDRSEPKGILKDLGRLLRFSGLG
ncbi:hypothetical protein PG1C_01615 [Rugosibacter aromaticivorans]|uniref:Transmembrane protein n=1 Tax=Rugosibacter aromaticivorans TaxID=1565605 RepID=A0A0C5J714_9PROT|nr:hypothetical protein [Rugosibacter aromaticivorans]AJP47513.1 hypothetical protein PG1C_01615 [Rugosibacter aromaticivorans]TBR13007.1 MAG: hypothetical protein EPO43_11905 [Rugosibacter sp.]